MFCSSELYHILKYQTDVAGVNSVLFTPKVINCLFLKSLNSRATLNLTYAFQLNSASRTITTDKSLALLWRSPLSSFLAEAVMQDLESKAVTSNDNIKTWDRYVDDVLATVKKDKTDDILLRINNTTKNIKFTKEEEHDNKLAFLDVLITKNRQRHFNHTSLSQENTHRSNFKLQ
jgi:hypothetical protein